MSKESFASKVQKIKATGQNTPVMLIFDLFALKSDLFLSVFEDHGIYLLSRSLSQNTFIHELFDLPHETLLPLLEKYATSIMGALNSIDSSGYFSDRLKECLPRETIQTIIEDDFICRLFLQEEDDLIKFCNQHNPNIPLNLLPRLDLTSNADKLKLLKFSPPLINSVTAANEDDCDKLINSILSKTYFDEIYAPARKSFTTNLINNLKKIILTEKSFVKILDNAATMPGDIFISTTDYPQWELDRLPFAGFCEDDNNIFLFSGKLSMAAIVSLLLHEATHKLINQKFMNDFEPFFVGDTSFETTEAAMWQELKNETKLYSLSRLEKYNNLGEKFKNSDLADLLSPLSWLHDMVRNYPANELVCEVFPHFVEYIALSILNNSPTFAPGRDFANILWHSMHSQLFDESSPDPLPELYYNSFKLLPDIEWRDKDLIKAKDIILTAEPGIDWMEGEKDFAKRLAFQSLPKSAKVSIMENYYKTTPADSILEFIAEYGARMAGFCYDIKEALLELEQEAFKNFSGEHCHLKSFYSLAEPSGLSVTGESSDSDVGDQIF